MNHSLFNYKLELERSNASTAFDLDFQRETSPAFLNLFQAAEALRTDGGPLVLQSSAWVAALTRPAPLPLTAKQGVQPPNPSSSTSMRPAMAFGPAPT